MESSQRCPKHGCILLHHKTLVVPTIQVIAEKYGISPSRIDHWLNSEQNEWKEQYPFANLAVEGDNIGEPAEILFCKECLAEINSLLDEQMKLMESLESKITELRVMAKKA